MNPVEKQVIRIGYVALADAAPILTAAQLGLDEKYGLKFVLSLEASWAGVRDKLLSGELDAAHVLYGLVYGVQLGIGGPKEDMAVLMGLNRNGQAITLSQQLAAQGALDGPSLARLMRNAPRSYTFAQTFPTGTHAMWLYYWLAANGIDPLRDARVITVPPPQMVAAMRAGQMDGFCVAEPWGRRAVEEGVGVRAAATSEIWPDHPEKVLGCTREFVQRHPDTCRAMTAAILEACRWLDLQAPGEMRFYDDGAVNFPWLSDGMWFMTQLRRWGLLKNDPDYLAVAQAVNQIALYKQAAELAGVPLPSSPMRSSTLMDGKVWDGSDPKAYAASFKIGKYDER